MEHHWKFTFKIEPKDGGGFSASAEGHPEIIEGATREEVEEKVRAKLAQLIGPELAAKVPLHALSSPEEAKKAFDITVKRSVFTTTGKLPEGTVAQPASPSSSAKPALSTSFSASSSNSSGPIEREAESNAPSKFLMFIVALLVTLFLAWAFSRR